MLGDQSMICAWEPATRLLFDGNGVIGDRANESGWSNQFAQHLTQPPVKVQRPLHRTTRSDFGQFAIGSLHHLRKRWKAVQTRKIREDAMESKFGDWYECDVPVTYHVESGVWTKSIDFNKEFGPFAWSGRIEREEDGRWAQLSNH